MIKIKIKFIYSKINKNKINKKKYEYNREILP